MFDSISTHSHSQLEASDNSKHHYLLRLDFVATESLDIRYIIKHFINKDPLSAD